MSLTTYTPPTHTVAKYTLSAPVFARCAPPATASIKRAHTPAASRHTVSAPAATETDHVVIHSGRLDDLLYVAWAKPTRAYSETNKMNYRPLATADAIETLRVGGRVTLCGRRPRCAIATELHGVLQDAKRGKQCTIINRTLKSCADEIYGPHCSYVTFLEALPFIKFPWMLYIIRHETPFANEGDFAFIRALTETRSVKQPPSAICDTLRDLIARDLQDI